MDREPGLLERPSVVKPHVVEDEDQASVWVLGHKLVKEGLERLGVATLCDGARLRASDEIDRPEESDSLAVSSRGWDTWLLPPRAPLSGRRRNGSERRLVFSEHDQLGILSGLGQDFFSLPSGSQPAVRAWLRGTGSSVAGE